MSVERRYSARHPVDFAVQIRYRNRRFLCARARDLCADGMSLDVQNLTLPPGTLLELEVDYRGKHLLVPAVVIHHSGSGVGVMFRDRQPELLRSILQQSAFPRPPTVPPSADERLTAC